MTETIQTTTQEHLDAYFTRTYKGKKVRRWTQEELDAVKEQMAKEEQDRLDAIEAERIRIENLPPREPDEWADNEIKQDEEFEAGEEMGGLSMSNAMLMGEDGVRAFYKELDDIIAKEKARLAKNATAAPRIGKWADYFHRKNKDKTKEEIEEGVVLKKDGKDDGWNDAVQKAIESNIASERKDEEVDASREAQAGELSPYMWEDNEVKPEEVYDDEDEAFGWFDTADDIKVKNSKVKIQAHKMKKTELERGLHPKSPSLVKKKDEQA